MWGSKLFKAKKTVPAAPPIIRDEVKFNRLSETQKYHAVIEKANIVQFQQPPPTPMYNSNGMTLDSAEQTRVADSMANIKSQFQLTQPNAPIALLDWYASQSFISYNFAAIMSQHWLINKVCRLPGRDAIRKGFDITSNDGKTKLDPDLVNDMRLGDKRYRLNENMVEFIRFGRIFGIRIARFVVDSPDPNYYENPFNIDGVRPNSYRGIAQVDPYWITPELDADAAANVGSIHFYEPTWWRISGQRIHRSHLMIFKTDELPDILKPTYFYGGVPVPQMVFERVYASDRTANEAPLLALTKRLKVAKINLEAAIANQGAFQQRMEFQAQSQNNFGTYFIGSKDEVEQFDTALTDFDALISSQYHLVSAIGDVPVTKLFGTPPKGFNSTGEYEESNYHESLESYQAHDLTPLVERHHAIMFRSDFAKRWGKGVETMVTWKPLDSMTAKEAAEVQEIKSRTDLNLANTGALDPASIQKRIAADPDSGYNGIEIETSEEPSFEDDPGDEDTEEESRSERN